MIPGSLHHMMMNTSSPTSGGIVFVGKASTTGLGNSSPTLSLTSLSGGVGTEPAEGDIVIAIQSMGASANVDMAVSTGGYTELCDLYGSDSYDLNLGIFYKLMGATPDTSVSFVGNWTSSGGQTCQAYVFRNVNQTTPLQAPVSTAVGANTQNPTPPSTTVVNDGSLVLAIGAGAVWEAGIFSSGDFTLDTVFRAATYSSACGVGFLAKDAGSFNPAQFTYSQSDSILQAWAAATLALIPA